MSDQEITCAGCGDTFLFREAEQRFYAERGLAAPPKRCKSCRQARRAQSGGDGAPPRDRGFGGGPRSNDRPRSRDGGAPGQGDRRRAGGGGFGDSRGPGGGFGSRPRRSEGFPRNDRPRGTFERRDAPRPAGERPAEAWGTKPGDGGNRPPRRHENGAAEGAPRERAPRARPERPKYDVTCAECGVQAQVPFKPLEGRQVFCQPCYKARKGTGGTGAVVGDRDSDTGIVE